MMQRVVDIAKKDDKTFQFVLKEPYGYSWSTALGKTSTPLCYIMRKKEAETNPMEKITAYVGSGPFIFNEAETRQGCALRLRPQPELRAALRAGIRPRRRQSRPRSIASSSRTWPTARRRWRRCRPARSIFTRPRRST